MRGCLISPNQAPRFFQLVTTTGAHRFCLPMTNADKDALRAARPLVAEWIDKLRLAGRMRGFGSRLTVGR
jgi:hypothetical protein